MSELIDYTYNVEALRKELVRLRKEGYDLVDFRKNA